MLARVPAVIAVLAAGYAVSACAGLPAFQWHLERTLAGEGSTALDCQRAIYELLQEAVMLPGGAVVAGTAVTAEKSGHRISPAMLDGSVLHAQPVTISALVPEPVTICAPVPGEGNITSVYRRVDSDLYVRVPGLAPPVGGYLIFDVRYPGEYVVAVERAEQASPTEPVTRCLDFAPPSRDPAARSAWKFYPVAPKEICGPLPLVLIHGSGDDRWGDFSHWAQYSDEAALLRKHFQVWNFSHPMSGVAAPIGLSRDYPAFSESVVAALDGYIAEAEEDGVLVDGERYFFSKGPYAILTHSQGGIKARALLVNYPEHAERVFAVVSLNCPHMGTPWATPEWVRHTLSKVGLTRRLTLEKIFQGVLAEGVLRGYINVDRQSDLDTGWANFDRAGGFGIPTRTFSAWYWGGGIKNVTLSPCDANQTNARELPGIADETFEPPALLDVYCGGLDCITPSERGGMFLDKFFVYAGYIVFLDDFAGALTGAAPQENAARSVQNSALRTVQLLMTITDSEGSVYPIAAYRVGDGFVPLQSELLLDGAETALIYKTRKFLGWEVPVFPTELREDLIREHTLALPEKLRILRGWSHLDTITGRYNPETGHSELFQQVLDDLLSVLPADDE